ncbi:MAG: hypothetical protein KDA41_21520, partial [Planctomycetales bacterium]|nr:hypothetical protein [Planctomycetales bacterium]
MFSLARTKLPSYVTPCYAAMATLIGALIVRWRSAAEPLGRLTTRAAFGSLIAVGLAIAVALPIAAAFFAPGEQWLGLIGAAPIIGGLLGFVYCERRQPALASLSLGVCAVVTATLLFGLAAARISRHQPIDALIANIHQATASPKIAGHGAHEPTWVFYAKQNVAVAGDPKQAGEFLRDPDAFVITTERALDDLRPHLPADVQTVDRAQFFLKKYDIVVVGRTPEQVRIAHANADASTTRR